MLLCDPFPSLSMYKHQANCLVKGCGKASHGKPYCSNHFTVSQRRKLNSELSALIRSSCCRAACKTGAPHENGEQYCTKCDEACCWMAG